MQKKAKYTIAIAGATGIVGREMLEILEDRNFPVEDIVLLESEESEGERLQFGGKSRTVRRLTKDSFHQMTAVAELRIFLYVIIVADREYDSQHRDDK